MKLDEIQDVEVLRTELKKRMCKCKKTFEKGGLKFVKGEYYDYEFDHEYYYWDIYSDDQVNSIGLRDKEKDIYFTIYESKEDKQ